MSATISIESTEAAALQGDVDRSLLIVDDDTRFAERLAREVRLVQPDAARVDEDVARERTGQGQSIDLSMLDSGLFFMFPDGFQNHALLDEDAIPGGLLIDMLYDLTLTKDGGITVAAANQEMQGRMLSAIGLLHLLGDERFDTMVKLVENLHIFRSLVAEKCLEYTSDELLALLREVEVPCAKCLTRDEVLAQEQLEANDSVSIVEHPHLGKLRIVRAPPRFGGQRLEASRPTPAHGEHTDSVLQSFGVATDRIDALKSNDVLG